MNHPAFTKFRRLIDAAITFDDLVAAKKFIRQGLRLAEQKECLGEIMYFKAQHAIVDEDFAGAIIYLDKAIAYNPEDGAAYNDKALCLSELGRIEGVRELFDKGIAVEPDYATIHHNKGWFLNKMGQHGEALACFQRALEIEPGRAVTYENMANTYENMGLKDEALRSYKEALRSTKYSFAAIKDQIKSQIKRLEHEIANGPH
jgi:tetratricopeptide (TPR) repeat protein